MGGNDGGSQTTTTEPWAPAQGFMKNIMEQLQANVGLDYDPGMTEGQATALQGMKDYYQNTLPGLIQAGQAGWGDLMRSPEEVAMSQQVQDMIAANTGAVTTQLMEEVMPGIRTGAAGAGQYGSSRQGIAEGLATGKTAEAAQRYGTDLVGNIYQKQLANQMNALSMLPTIGEMGLAGNRGLWELGNLERAQETASQNEYWNRLLQISGLAPGFGGAGGTTVGTTSGAGGPSALQGAAGGAMAGSAFGPWGAAIGGVLGGLGAR